MKKTITIIALLLAASASAQEAEYERDNNNGETPYGYEVRYDSQGFGVMETWDDGDGNPNTAVVAMYVEGWSGGRVWATVHVDRERRELEVWDLGAEVPDWITEGDGTWDGAKCRDRQGINRAFGARWEGNMKDAVVAAIFGGWYGGFQGAIAGYVGTVTIKFFWDFGSLTYACGWGY